MTPLANAILPVHTRFGPVFVVGHARSGTSLMCRLLLDHLGVNFGTESQFILRYQKRLRKYGDLSDDPRLRLLLDDISRERFFQRTRRNFGFSFDVDRAMRSIPERTYAGVLRAIFDQFAASQGHVRWGDKTPEYCRSLPSILELFPDAQFLHVARDGRDVAQSVFKTGFGPTNAYEAAVAWKETLDAVRRFSHDLRPGAFLEVRYEDLLADPRRTMLSIATFLSIDNREELLDAIGARLRVQVRADNASKWRDQLSPREAECFEAFAGDELMALGYRLEFRPRSGRDDLAELLFWQVQGLWRRVSDGRFWSDNWYKVRLRLRDQLLPIRAILPARPPSTALHGSRLDS